MHTASNVPYRVGHRTGAAILRSIEIMDFRYIGLYICIYLYIMERFILEILAFILIIYLLKRIWNDKVKVIMGQAVIGINVFACFIYIYGLMYQSMPLALVVPKVFLHGLVALIIHTLFTIDTKKDE